MKQICYTFTNSPVGMLYLSGNDEVLKELLFASGREQELSEQDRPENRAAFREVIRQLDAYFSGVLKEFDLPLEPEGTPFQKAAWKALLSIPYGKTLTYGEQARRMGNPKACRAVGAANGRNPISIIIPCHRVIGQSGKLTGYGGGLDAKKYLLQLEAGALQNAGA
ncbi:MAG: methylated-DNA--[protein]-cysteine S-methyltransferase [Planctomycetota bacterium]|jgi:methylated-DNA-[protein]-cysteine S-methyltransferase